MNIVIASGYFDPLHIGHVEYLQKAKALGDRLIVLVNTDYAAFKKKGYFFMKQEDRLIIIRSLKCVDEAYLALDDDGTVWKSLELFKPDIFAKGGDRTMENLPEQELSVCKKYGIKVVTGLGNKIESSSELLNKCSKR